VSPDGEELTRSIGLRVGVLRAGLAITLAVVGFGVVVVVVVCRGQDWSTSI
jgi:hypothetical protein